MKTLFIIGITLFVLLSLLKKVTRLQSAESPHPIPGPAVHPQYTRATLARQVAENPDDARLWAELGAVIYRDAQSRGAEVEDPDITQADEHFRTAASLAPQDASILVDWAQWKARLVADNDELRMFTYEEFVKPRLRKASELAPGNGEIPYHHAVLLAYIAERQLLLGEDFNSLNDPERLALLRERDLLLWDAIDLVHQAERKRHDRLECLSLRAKLFVDLAEERDGGEEKYLLQEAKTSFAEYKRLSGKASPGEDEVTLSLEHLRSEVAVVVARPVSPPASVPSVVELGSPRPRASAPALKSADRRFSSATADASPAQKSSVSAAAPDALPLADFNARALKERLRLPKDAFASAPLAAPQMPVGPEAISPDALSTPPSATSMTSPDLSQAAAALAPPIATASSSREDSPSAPNWKAPVYSVPDYARPHGGAEHNAPAAPIEPGGTDKGEHVRSGTHGAPQPFAYRPPSR